MAAPDDDRELTEGEMALRIAEDAYLQKKNDEAMAKLKAKLDTTLMQRELAKLKELREAEEQELREEALARAQKREQDKELRESEEETNPVGLPSIPEPNHEQAQPEDDPEATNAPASAAAQERDGDKEPRDAEREDPAATLLRARQRHDEWVGKARRVSIGLLVLATVCLAVFLIRRTMAGTGDGRPAASSPATAPTTTTATSWASAPPPASAPDSAASPPASASSAPALASSSQPAGVAPSAVAGASAASSSPAPSGGMGEPAKTATSASSSPTVLSPTAAT